MTTITIKNIPPALYERIKQKAKTNRRSINNEIITIVENALGIRTQVKYRNYLRAHEKSANIRQTMCSQTMKLIKQ